MGAPRIVIAGGGLAGLTLARCLKARDIRSIVLQKTPGLDYNAYGIDLQPWAYLPLLKDLRVDSANFRRLFDLKAQLQGETSLVDDNNLGEAPIRCHRGLLQRWLSQGLDIRCGHEVENVNLQLLTIRIRVDDKVTNMPADILIAADGSHSRIRETLSSDVIEKTELKTLSYVVFNSRRQMSRDEMKAFVSPHLPGEPFERLQRGHTCLSVELNASGSGNETVANYTFSRPANFGASDCLYMPDRAPNEAKNGPGNKWDQFERELGQLKDLPQRFKDLFDPSRMRKDRILNWLMRSSLMPLRSLRSLAEQNVLFIGDAAHTMPIIGGEGANLAIKDAVDLAEKIATKETNHGHFFVERYDDWTQRVQRSEQRLAQMHSTNSTML